MIQKSRAPSQGRGTRRSKPPPGGAIPPQSLTKAVLHDAELQERREAFLPVGGKVPFVVQYGLTGARSACFDAEKEADCTVLSCLYSEQRSHPDLNNFLAV